MTTHQATPPKVVADYFGFRWTSSYEDHPIVAQVFYPGRRGWRQYPIRKRVSGAWAAKAKAEGITDVALTYQGRTADFSIRELIRR